MLACLPPRRRAQLVLLAALMLAGAAAEVLSLGAIVPFLAILVDPARALQRPLVAKVVALLGLDAAGDIRWPVTMLFAATAAAAGLVRFALIYAMSRLNYGIGHELGSEVYRRTLYQPYEAHVARNSSEIVGSINKVDIVVVMIFSLLNAAGAVLMGSFIVAAMIAIDPLIATVALASFVGIYAAVSAFTRKRLDRNSEVLNSAFNLRVQSMQEGLGGIRDVLLDQTQPVFARRFDEIDWPLRQAQASINIIGPSPRFAVEALGIILISMLGYRLTVSGGGVGAAIPTLGALALGAQRLMPLVQMIFQGWVMAAGNREVLADVISLLRQPVADGAQHRPAPLPFNREIRLEDVSFRYQAHSRPVLHGLGLTIPKGARIGFMGTTGSGKSTITDLLMGLLVPTSGRIVVDDTPLVGAARLAWQRNVAHVPQAIFLADASFAENIAFGLPPEQIDLPRVRRAAQRAQISEFIESAPQGYAAKVGERGVRLSGGQRQRIGIARALYKQAEVIVFDEATSALDNETEHAVMEAIASLDRNLTIIIVAHRLGTLRNCARIVELGEGGIRRTGTYEDVVAQAA